MLSFDTVYKKLGKYGYRGIYVKAGLAEYASTRVYDRYHDVRRAQEIAEQFSALSHTGFDDIIKRMSLRRDNREYSIAEALAECFLEDYGYAKFPYVAARDNKNPKTHQNGADLVGFFYLQNFVYFLFGEVKFSGETKYPPTVVRKSGQLMTQLQDIDSNADQRDNLITWLAQKVSRTDHWNNYLQAYELYYKDETKIKIIGALVRSVDHNPKDIVGVFEQIICNLRSEYFEMVAIYVDKDDMMLAGGRN